MSYGKIILGDNQFLGVNHSSQAKAAEMFDRFKCPDAILEVIGFAYDAGVRDFMFTTHDRYEPVLEEIRRSNLFPGMHYTPCLPYAHKYWNKLVDLGPVGTLASTLAKINPLAILPAALSLLAGNTNRIVRLLTEIEILMCKGLPVRGVFLLNLAFDLLMAMELSDVVEQFSEVVENRLGVHAGFFTMNHARANEFLCDKVGIRRPWICSNFNIDGFRMHPSKETCAASFSSGRSRNIAMSVLASGRASPSDAMAYVRDEMKKGNVEAVVFGSSTKINISSNAKLILG